MVRLSLFAIVLVAAYVNGAPLTKRIAQVIADSTAKWEQACLTAGGGQQCNPLSITAFSTLLAAPGPCEQQNAADQMIDLAKTLKSDPTMIKLTQIFVQQPRNTPNSQSVPYCQTAPKNPELNGLFQCQFQGADLKTFVGGIAVGQPGTIPFGHSSPISPPGSCPANPSGPIAGGSQLVDITENPGVGSVATGSGNNATPSKSHKSPSAHSCTSAPSATPVNANADNNAPIPSTAAAPATSSGFHLQNGQAAQKLNAQFASLTADSPCTDGEQACVNSGFAQCVDGKFVITSCGAPPLTCAALPLVNKAGTSITCTTEADALQRIQATGASGGITGS